ncbi:hypothetical protein C8J57DRAFT_1570045 [Mycena rebaudengoi]|nr:hypothetical protein C8J57DRAFT_1570045 [Mycena rebaudengoi]
MPVKERARLLLLPCLLLPLRRGDHPQWCTPGSEGFTRPEGPYAPPPPPPTRWTPPPSPLSWRPATNGTAINDLVSRVHNLEDVSSRITALEATAQSQAGTLQVLLTRASTQDAAIGKRPLEHSDDPAAKRQHLTVPAAFAYHVSSLGPPPAPAAGGYPAPPAHPSAFPHPPAGAAPQVRPDRARQAHLGPMTWSGNFHAAPRNLILNVLGSNTTRNVHFTSRKGSDEHTALLTFEADTVATWFISTWNNNPRASYEVCVASPLNG